MNKSVSIDLRVMHYEAFPSQTQDDAFTLAYYLLGSEDLAAVAVQAAFEKMSSNASTRHANLRLEILRRVIGHVQAGRRPAIFHEQTARDEIVNRLAVLNAPQRTAAVLVDVLGLNYTETGSVLGCSVRQAGKLVAQARLRLSYPAAGGQSVH